MATKTEITKAVSMLAVAYGREADVPLLQVYTLGLSDLPAADLERATAAAIRQCKFMPSPAELRELAGVQVPRLDGGKSAAAKAWDRLQEARSNNYLASAVYFEDFALAATVRAMGGWAAILARPNDDWNIWGMARFLSFYPGIAAGQPQDEGAFPGIGSDPPVRIGRGGVETVKALPAPARSPEVAGLLDVGRLEE